MRAPLVQRSAARLCEFTPFGTGNSSKAKSPSKQEMSPCPCESQSDSAPLLILSAAQRRFASLRAFLKRFPPQQWLAALLLFVVGSFHALPLLQAFSSDPGTRLPACCRRYGSHHCAMDDQTVKVSFYSIPEIGPVSQHCPLYPHSSTAPVARFHAGLAAAAAFFANIVSHPVVRPQIQAVYRLSLDRSRQKRGPPSLPIL